MSINSIHDAYKLGLLNDAGRSYRKNVIKDAACTGMIGGILTGIGITLLVMAILTFLHSNGSGSTVWSRFIPKVMWGSMLAAVGTGALIFIPFRLRELLYVPLSGEKISKYINTSVQN